MKDITGEAVRKLDITTYDENQSALSEAIFTFDIPTYYHSEILQSNVAGRLSHSNFFQFHGTHQREDEKQVLCEIL